MEDNLSIFGSLFIKAVRDNTLFVLEGIIKGHMKSPIDKEMYEQIDKMPVEDIKILKDMAYRMVDLSLHNMLFMLENDQEWIMSNKGGKLSIAELSDGLSGELYTSDGWISKFSEYPASRGL